MRRILLPVFLVGLLAVLTQLPGSAQDKQVADELLVKVRPGLAGAIIDKVHTAVGGRLLKQYPQVGNWQRVKLPPGMSVSEGLAKYRGQANVVAVEPNYRVSIDATPNDPRMGQLWGMTKIKAPAAWDVTTGSANVVVAVVDTGVNYNHEDLRNNMWRNPWEIAGNRVDDDRNGYVDDVYGIDEANNDGDPMDDAGHGTHVSGTIGGQGNNAVGVAGVNWQVKIMALKFISGSSGSTADAVACYNYLIAMKRKGVNVRAVNNSWGGAGSSQALRDAIDTAAGLGILSACAAGNGGSDQVGDNNDASPYYPAAYTSAGIIAVAASDSSDNRASFSNYGATSVDLAAPGVSINSTYYSSTSSYANMSGTSMATPHVAGAAALLAAYNPGASVAAIKSALMTSVDQLSAWSGKVASGGRMNLARALQALGGGTTPPPTPTGSYKPDMYIRPSTTSSYTGNNIYGTTQSVGLTVTKGTKATYQLVAQNDGTTSDTLVITGTPGGTGWTVRYYNANSGGTDVTTAVTGTGYRTAALSPGSYQYLRLEVTPDSTVAAGATRDLAVTATSAADATKTDTVHAVTKVADTTSGAAVTSVSLSASPISPQPVGAAITVTANAIGAPAEYRFSVGYRNGFFTSWTFLNTYGPANSVIWRPTQAGSYTLRVYARAQGSTRGYEAYRILSYSVVGSTTAGVQTENPASTAPWQKARPGRTR